MDSIHDKYRLLVENMPDGFAYHRIETDPEGNPVDYTFLEINDAFTELTGLPKEKVIGKKVTDVLPGIEKSYFDWIGTYNRVTLNGTAVRFEQYSQPRGRWFEVTAYSDAPGFFITLFRDISSAKKLEISIKESEEKYRTLAESAGAIFWEYDIAANSWIYVAPQVTKILGYKPDEWCRNQFWTEHIHPDDRNWASEHFEFCIKHGRDYVFEYRFIKKDGSVSWLRDDVKVELDDGKAVKLRGFIIDITERKKAELALQENEAILEKSQEIAHVGSWVLDLETNYLTWSAEVYRILGLNPHNFVATYESFLELVHPDDRVLVDTAYTDSVKELGNEYKVEHRIIRRDNGEIRHVHEKCIHERNKAGEIIKSIGVIQDITERKMVEEQVRFLSLHDRLTGLYSRNYLEDSMTKLDTPRQLPISIIMADLNGLKLINDTYGHTAGDEILITAADIFRDSCRHEDIISRFGGDEFVILLPATTEEEAHNICNRIIRKNRRVRIREIPVSISLGVGCKESADRTLKSVLREAEDNMYKHKMVESRSTKHTVLKALLHALEAKSYETEAHTRRMKNIANRIGEQLNLPDTELSRLNLLITLHDIGKINIAEEILTKEGYLDTEEWDAIKKHPEIGFRIARATEEFSHVAEDILAHHEKWDGSGYPHGLKEKDIPLLARIAAIADAYEVMTYGRPYKKALHPDQVVEELKKSSGKHFDPALVDIFLSLLKKGKLENQLNKIG
ncbi:MAG: PAS domain S-box protein [Bacillota bacterium]|nr:PAS domain S-box protein [Bacillota bacterium]